MIKKYSPTNKTIIKRNKIKILFIIDHLDSGGAQKQMIELIKGLNKKVFNIYVCSLDDNRKQLEPELKEINIPVFGLNQYGKFDLATLFSLYKFIKSKRFSLVHTYLFTSDSYGRIAALLAKTPIVISSIRSVDSWKKWYHIFADRILTQFTDKIIVNAKVIRTFLIKKEKIAREKIKIIYNGIDLQKWNNDLDLENIRDELGIKKDELVIGILARNDPVKDHRTFFQAAALVHDKLPHTKFLAAGYRMQAENIRRLAAKYKIDDFLIRKNYLPNIKKIIKLLDISVLTSLIEGCPNFVLESMVMSKPVVATRVGGIPEIVVDNKTGYLIPPQKPSILANRLIKLLKNPEQRKELGANGLRRIKKEFSLKKMLKETEKTYLSLLQLKTGK